MILDSSKDLEKDEREWTDQRLLPKLDDAGYEWVVVVPKARLQQVEAELEREKVLRQDALEYQAGAESRLTQVEAELSIAREALEELVRLKEHPEHDRLTAEKQAAWNRARQVLARLQAKEEQT
jgi:hypothetical protein